MRIPASSPIYNGAPSSGNFFKDLAAVEVPNIKTGALAFYFEWGRYLLPIKSDLLRKGTGIKIIGNDASFGPSPSRIRRTSGAYDVKRRFIEEHNLGGTKFPFVKYVDDVAYLAHFLPAREGVYQLVDTGDIFMIVNGESMASGVLDVLNPSEACIFPKLPFSTNSLYHYTPKRLFGVLSSEFPLYIRLLRIN